MIFKKKNIFITGSLLIILIIISIFVYIKIKNKDSNIDWSNYEEYNIELSESITIEESGVYYLSGSILDGLIEINTKGNVKLVLDNVSIKNSSGPCIYVSKAKKVVIELVNDSTLEDALVYESSYQDMDACIYSKSDLVIEGSGTLNIQANYQDGIISKDNLIINNGIYNITSKDDGLRGRDYLEINGGTFNINSSGKAVKSSESILINNGEFNISSSDDAIHAEDKLEINDGIIKVKDSYEGIEAYEIIINGGDIEVISSDDAINASGDNTGATLTINDGNIFLNSSGDAIDANGSIYLNGGSVQILGPTSNADGAIDYDNEFVITGGEILALGSSGMALGSSSSSTQYGVLINLTSSYEGNLSIIDSSNEELVNYESDKVFSSIFYSSSKLNKESYTLKINDDIVEEFSISNISTTIGNRSHGMFHR